MNCAFASVLGGGIAATTMAVLTPSAETKSAGPGAAMSSHYALLAMSDEDLSAVDVAMMNLLCARGLPGTERLDQSVVLRKLDQWAEHVRLETERHLYRVSDPRYAEHYGHSEARLRAEFLVQVLQEDCGVRYNADRIRDVDFSNAADLFIHGMIDNPNGGTCASMPVLYAAVGRRLGYPIRLVLAKQHVFCRWEDGQERFNIEGTAIGGVDFFPDDHYRTWPAPLSDRDVESGEFLRSLSPVDELALFVLNRGACLAANGEHPEALACYTEAHRLMPSAMTPLLALGFSLADQYGGSSAIGHAQREGHSPASNVPFPQGLWSGGRSSPPPRSDGIGDGRTPRSPRMLLTDSHAQVHAQ